MNHKKRPIIVVIAQENDFDKAIALSAAGYDPFVTTCTPLTLRANFLPDDRFNLGH
jgi:hypothetical protein